MSYHIDKKIKLKWDSLKSGKLKKKDEDRVYIVDGRERTGKSVFALQQAKYVDPHFNINRVCFTPEEFLKQIRTAPPGSAVVFDEAFRGLSSKSTQSKVNKMIVQAMMEMGQRNLVIFIVLPTIFLLELYAAVLRSNALFHIYKDKAGKRCFKTYNYRMKSILYNTGKKKGFSYAFPIISTKKTGGRFFERYAIDETAYRKKKMDSLILEETTPKIETSKFVRQRDRLLSMNFIIFKKLFPKLTKPQYTNIAGIFLDDMSDGNVVNIISDQKEMETMLDWSIFPPLEPSKANNYLITLTNKGKEARKRAISMKYGYEEALEVESEALEVESEALEEDNKALEPLPQALGIPPNENI